MCIHTNPKLHTVKGEYTNAYNPKQKRKTLNKVGHHQPSNRNNSTTKKGVLPLLKNLKTASLEKTAGIEKLRLRTHPLALDIIPFYFLVIGEVTPPAFATAPTHVECGAFASSMKRMLPLKASQTSPSGVLESFLKSGCGVSLEGKSAKLE